MNWLKLKDKFRTSKWRIYFARVGAIVIVLLNDIRLSKLGLVFIVIGIAIRFWASGHLQKRKKIIMSGPYNFTRNPLYIGSIFIGIGFWIMSNNFIVFFIFFLLFTVMYGATVKREESELLQKFQDEYKNYLDCVPRFIPNFKNISRKSEEKFSFEISIKNKEYLVLLGVAGMIFAMAFMHSVIYPFIFQEGKLSELFSGFLRNFFKL